MWGCPLETRTAIASRRRDLVRHGLVRNAKPLDGHPPALPERAPEVGKQLARVEPALLEYAVVRGAAE